MSQGALRAALAVFALGVLGVWLVKPIGDACPDVGRLPAGSQSSSSPSFAPPLTRTCTYTTADGTKARKRYVPIVDWLVLGVVAGVVAVGVGLAGPGAPPVERAAKRQPASRPRRAPRAPKPGRAKRAPRTAAPPRASEPAPAPVVGGPDPEDRATARERERQERARRRAEG